MTGYSGKTVTEKFGVRPEMKIIFVNDEKNIIRNEIKFNQKQIIKQGTADMIICITRSKEDIRLITTFIDQLNEKGMIWMCWAKKISPLFSGVTEDMIRNYALACGLVDIKVCAVNEDYSALKIVRRKK